MEINTWIRGCKVRVTPWIDGKNIYMEVQYFTPGSSIYCPVWEKVALIRKNEKGMNVLKNYLDSLVAFIGLIKIPNGGKICLDFETNEI